MALFSLQVAVIHGKTTKVLEGRVYSGLLPSQIDTVVCALVAAAEIDTDNHILLENCISMEKLGSGEKA